MAQLKITFEEYHEKNPQIYEAFRGKTLETIKKGFKNYGAKGIFEILRWQTGVCAKDDEFKVNNNFTPFYARLFEREYPAYEGFFRKKKSKFDINQ